MSVLRELCVTLFSSLRLGCNGATAATSAGAFSCNLSLNPGVNLVIVRATDIAGNVSGVPLHVNYAAALPAPTSLQISPASANVLVGATQQFTAIDQLGRPRTDATWTVDNTSVATISTDASPILTGVAAGTVTLTGSVGGVSTQIQVNVLAGTSLPVGTVLWSAPSTPGFTVQQIVQAVPTANGPDLYSVENNSNNTPLIRAMTSDGRQLWSAQFAPGTNIASVQGSSARPAVPDGSGGILLMVVANPGGVPSTYQLVDLDGQTGTQLWTYNLASYFFALSGTAAIRGDGTIFKLQPIQGQPALIGLDPNTGSTVFTYVPPRSSYAFNAVGDPNCGSSVSGSAPGSLYSPTIGPDGTVYSAVSKIDLTATNYCDWGPYSITMTDSLLKVAPDGSTSLTQIRQDVSNQTYSGGSFVGNYTIPNSNVTVWLYQPAPSAAFSFVIPDGQGGVLMPYGYAVNAAFAPQPLQGHIAHVAAGGGLNDYTLPLVPFGGMVLGENGTAFATDGAFATNGSSVVSFAASSGSINWTYQPPSGVSNLFATESGGITILDNQLNQIPLDSNGTPGAPISGFNALAPRALNHWLGTSLGSLATFVGSGYAVASSSWPFPGGGGPGDNASPGVTIATFLARVPGQTAAPPWGTEDGSIKELKNVISKATNSFRNYSVTGVGAPKSTPAAFLAENQDNLSEVVGFIGDSEVIGTYPNWFSAGFAFHDAALLRTPNCDDPNQAGLCYNLYTVNHVVGAPPCNIATQFQWHNNCYAISDRYHVPNATGPICNLHEDLAPDGLCYKVYAPDFPCQPDATQLGNWCYAMPPDSEFRDSLSTTAKIVFIASCETTDVFINWWNLNLNPTPGGRVLVVPDIAAMTANQGADVPALNTGFVDLLQGAVGYEKFIQTIVIPGKTVQNAIDAANTAIQQYYATEDFSQNPNGKLARVIFKPIGNAGLCLRGACQ